LKFINLLQNISTVIESLNDFKDIKLVDEVSSYNLTNKSLMLDIGSGFGKPVFHTAFQLNCESWGLEVVPARVEFCIDFFYEYLHNKDFFNEIERNNIGNNEFLTRKKLPSTNNENSCKDEDDTETNKSEKNDIKNSPLNNMSDEDKEEEKPKLKRLPLKKKKPVIPSDDESGSDRSEMDEEIDKSVLEQCQVDLKYEYSSNWWDKIKFILKDATKLKTYTNDKGVHFTHIYSYNKLMNFECRKKMSSILNNTKFKILSWYSNPKQTLKAGLKNVKFIGKVAMNATSTEKFSVYIYMKVK
jgi:hypothetical protein